MDMKPLSDKDFDKFFHDKFADFEEKPSAALWSVISKLLSNKKRRSSPVLWVAAASLAVVLGAGIWFSSQKEPIYLTGGENSAIVSQQKKPSQVVVRTTSSANVKTGYNVSTSKTEKVFSAPIKQDVAVNAKEEASTLPVTKKATEKDQATQITLAAIPEPVKEADLNVSTPEESLAISTNVDEEMQDVTTKQTRIKSVGSLVNFVVSKVDKRKKKIIEFEDNDEGTKVSGFNFGLLKFQLKD
jgi:hypothetical protein